MSRQIFLLLFSVPFIVIGFIGCPSDSSSLFLEGDLSYQNIITTYGEEASSSPVWTVNNGDGSLNYSIIATDGNMPIGISISSSTGVITVGVVAVIQDATTYTVTATGTGSFIGEKTTTIAIAIMEVNFSYQNIITTYGEEASSSPVWTVNNENELLNYSILAIDGNMPFGISIDEMTGKITVGAEAVIQDTTTYIVTATGSGLFIEEKTNTIAITIVESKRTFFATNLDDYSTYTLNANLMAISDHSAVYVEEGTEITTQKAKDIADIFENAIYDIVRTHFAEESDVDGNGQVILLLLDIIDGFTGEGGYVAGYFSPYHILDYDDSNKADMIYLDVNPMVLGSERFMDTVAHEFQHLVNYADYLRNAGGGNDTWINEGLSSAAEYLYNEKHVQSRLDYYNKDVTGSISSGNNFFMWNASAGIETDILADYTTVYIFFQWLRIHASNGVGIYKDIMSNSNKDYLAVKQSMESRIYNTTNVEWANIIRDWYLAIYDLANSNSLYGFNNEFTLDMHLFDGASSTVELLPGEGIFDGIPNSFTPTSPPSGIGYAGINIDTDALDFDGTTYDGSVLLAWNGTSNNSNRIPLTAPVSAQMASLDIQKRFSINTNTNSLPTSYPIGVSFPNPGSGEIRRDNE